jgi:hypothetical protein
VNTILRGRTMTQSERLCLFCGNTDLSKEHVFAQWLLEELDLRKKKMRMQHSTILGLQISERPLTLSTLINGLVCKRCNNGWLSQIEGRVKPHLLNLLKGSLTLALQEQHQLLSLWIYKTAIVLNYASNYRKIVPKRHFKYLNVHRRIPENVCVLFGFSEEAEELDWIQSQTIIHIGNRKISKEPRFKDIYKITFQLNHILFKVIYSPFYQYQYLHDSPDHVLLYPNLQRLETFEVAKDIHSFDIGGSIYDEK